MVDRNTKSRAEQVADELVWRLEILQHRCRYNLKTGEYRQLPTRVRRFANACPTDIVADVIECIVKKAPYTDLVFNGEKNPELKYRPTATSIRKDDSLKNGTKDNTYTIIQDLILDTDADSYRVWESSSCGERVRSEYYWDEVDIMECPQGGQGVSYRIVDVNRDKDTDLFSYRLQETRAITQHLEEHVTECSDDEVVTVEEWDKVYTDLNSDGTVARYRYDDIEHSGQEIEVPKPCDDDYATTGTLVKVEIGENEDCTLKIRVTKTTSKYDEAAEYLRYRDRYSKRDMNLEKNRAPVAGDKSGVEYRVATEMVDGVERPVGIKTTVEITTNPDGTVNRKVTEDAERYVEKAEETFTLMPRHCTVTWENRNAPEPADSIPPGFSYGSWKCEKTPGGLYTNTFTGVRNIASQLGYSCTDVTTLHTDVAERTIESFPSAPVHVTVARDGKVYSYEVNRDGNGAIFEKSTLKTEIPYENFRRIVSQTLLGKTVRTYHRNQSSPLSDPAEGVVGTTEFQVTDGRLYDLVQETFVLNRTLVALGFDCARTVFDHRDSSEVTVPEMGDHTEAAGGGFYRTVKFARDPSTGAVRRQTDVNEEIPFPSSVVVRRVTPRYVQTQVTNRNLRDMTAAQLISEALGVGTVEQRETNPGGSVNQTITSTVPNEEGDFSAKCELDVTRHGHETEKALPKSAPVEAGTTITAGGGKHRSETVTVDDNNVKTKRERVDTEFDHEYGSRVHEDALQAHQIIEETSSPDNAGDVDGHGEEFTATEEGSEKGEATKLEDSLSAAGTFNVKARSGALGSDSVKGALVEEFSSGKLVTGGGYKRGIQIVADSDLTPGGRFHTKKHKYVPKPQKWLDATCADGAGGHYTWNFRNLTQAQVQELLADVCNVAAGASNQTGSLYGSFNNHPFCRRALNDFGLYDGSCGFESRNVYGSGSGSGKKIKEVPASIIAQWTEKSAVLKPVSQLDPVAGDYAAGADSMFYMQTTTSKYQMVTGVGKNSLSAYCRSPFWASPSIHINPTTEAYTVTACVEHTTKIELVKGAVLPDAGGNVTLVENLKGK